MMNEPDNNVEETPERPYRTEDNQYVEEIVNFNDLDEATAMNDDCTDPEAGCSSKKPNKYVSLSVCYTPSKKKNDILLWGAFTAYLIHIRNFHIHTTPFVIVIL